MKRIINKYRISKSTTAHYHEYINHGTMEDFYTCRICGQNVPKYMIDNSNVYKTLIVK